MKRWPIILLLFLLTGCPWDEQDKKGIERPSMCFEIVHVQDVPASINPMLLNKCTGDTYILLQTPLQKRVDQLTPDQMWNWYKVDIGYGGNVVGGISKTPQ